MRTVSCTMRSGSGTGSFFSRIPLTSVKIAVFTPMPNASDSNATAAKPGLFERLRQAWRKSWSICSSQHSERASRCSSLACSTPPYARLAASRAS